MEQYVTLAQNIMMYEQNKDIVHMEAECVQLYNYFVNHPLDLLVVKSPFHVGTAFYLYLRLIQDKDKEICEVKTENAFLCFSQSFSDNGVSDSQKIIIALRFFIMLSKNFNYLEQRVYRLFGSPELNVRVSPFKFYQKEERDLIFEDIPTNTKLLYLKTFLAQYFNSIDCTEMLIFSNEKSDFEKSYVEYKNEFSKSNVGKEEQCLKGCLIMSMLYKDIVEDIKKYSQHQEF